ncbi:MAG: zinc ribbon domain-containing protein [Spirochaetales bacterium]
MAYCPRCGTENDPSATHCPLCATRLPRFEDEGPGQPAWPAPEDSLSRVFATPGQRRRRAFTWLSVALLFPAVLVTGVDLLVNGSVTWSWIPDLALVGLFAVMTAGFLLFRRLGLLLAAWTVIAAVLLIVTDALSSASAGGLAWSLRLGLPAVALAAVLIAAVGSWVRRHPAPGWNLLGHLCLGAAFYCASLEALIRASLAATGGLWWSGIVALVLVPFGVLFQGLQRFSSRPLNLRQTFHL